MLHGLNRYERKAYEKGKDFAGNKMIPIVFSWYHHKFLTPNPGEWSKKRKAQDDKWQVHDGIDALPGSPISKGRHPAMVRHGKTRVKQHMSTHCPKEVAMYCLLGLLLLKNCRYFSMNFQIKCILTGEINRRDHSSATIREIFAFKIKRTATISSRLKAPCAGPIRSLRALHRFLEILKLQTPQKPSPRR